MGLALTLAGKTAVAANLLGATPFGPTFTYIVITHEDATVEYAMLTTYTLHGTVDISERFSTGYAYATSSPITSVVLSNDGSTPLATLDFGPAGSGATIELNTPVNTEIIVVEKLQFTVQKNFGTASLSSPLRDAIARGLSDGTADISKMALTGATTGTIKFYSGTMPASADDAVTGDLLATWTYSRSEFSAVAGIFTLTDPVTVTASAAGTATYFRMNAPDGGVLQGTVGISAGNVLLSTVTFTPGGSFIVNSFDVAPG